MNASKEQMFSSILILDDMPLFRDALSMTIKTIPGVRNVTATGSLKDALTHIGTRPPPDLIMLGLDLPDANGLDGLIRMRNATTDIPIIAISQVADSNMKGMVMCAGAQGFVPKNSQRETFLAAFDAVASGTRFPHEGFDEIPEHVESVEPPNIAQRRISTLTARQAHVFQLICEGKFNQQIAFELSIAEATVKAHVTAILRKLGAQSRTQAILVAKQAESAKHTQQTAA